MIVFETARLLMELVVLGRPKNTGVRAYAESLRRRLEESGITAIAPQK
jgi:hypothetical protein